MSRKPNGLIVKCTSCQCEKARGDFYKNSRGNGVNQPCKECTKQVWIKKRYGAKESFYDKRKYINHYSF